MSCPFSTWRGLVGVCTLALIASGAAVVKAGDGSRLADIGPAPAVELTDSRGEPFQLAETRGKVVLVSFIFTTCGGTCPATTHNLYRVQKALEAVEIWGDRVEFVSITLDPERDTPEVLGRYADIYGVDRGHWHFLTGSPDQIDAVLDAWDMWARPDSTGSLDHPSRIFLLDPRGHRREIYNLGFLETDAVVEDIQCLLDETAPKP